MRAGWSPGSRRSLESEATALSCLSCLIKKRGVSGKKIIPVTTMMLHANCTAMGMR